MSIRQQIGQNSQSKAVKGVLSRLQHNFLSALYILSEHVPDL